jgi:hypothetical protein
VAALVFCRRESAQSTVSCSQLLAQVLSRAPACKNRKRKRQFPHSLEILPRWGAACCAPIKAPLHVCPVTKNYCVTRRSMPVAPWTLSWPAEAASSTTPTGAVRPACAMVTPGMP